MRQLKSVMPLVGTRVSTGIAALDELLGRNRDAPHGSLQGFHMPSVVLLTGQPGVGKTTLLHAMTGIWGLPSLLFGGHALTTGPVIKMVADGVLTKPENLLVIDDGNGLTSADTQSLRADNRLVIVVLHTEKRKLSMELAHGVDVWLHMERRMERRVHVGTTLSRIEKNRFGQTGEIFRLTGSPFWRSE